MYNCTYTCTEEIHIPGSVFQLVHHVDIHSFQFCRDIMLQTAHRGRVSLPKDVCESDHTHSLTSIRTSNANPL